MPERRPATWLPLSIPSSRLQAYSRALCTGDRASTALALGRAMATSRCWDRFPGCRIVLRLEPEPRIALLGSFEPQNLGLLSALHRELLASLEEIRYIPWPEADQLVRTLALKLVEELGSDRIAEARFEAIPRGGLVVLGILAQLLDIRPEQMRDGSRSSGTLVLVDDCSLTGMRCQQALARSSENRVVFAHLLSNPALRHALEAREDRLEACISAQDVIERQELPGANGAAWSQRWHQRTKKEGRYWFGSLKHWALPWNEPDRSVWDDERQEILTAWKIVPPELCSKNQLPKEGAVPLVVVEEPKGVAELAPGTFHVATEEGIALANFDNGQRLALAGTAAQMWDSLMVSSSFDAAASKLVENYDVGRHRILQDLEGFLETLIHRGLLTLRDEA